MRFTQQILVSFVAIGIASIGCSSAAAAKKTKAAPGTATKPTTKKPPSTPAPTTKAGSNVSGSKSSATATDQECAADAEGKGVCVDTFVVFCSGTKLYALDCAESFGAGATCAEIDGVIDCAVTVEE